MAYLSLLSMQVDETTNKVVGCFTGADNDPDVGCWSGCGMIFSFINYGIKYPGGDHSMQLLE